MTNDQITQPRPTIHHMKVWPQFFPSLEDGSKTFEARKDDRGFRVGDVLRLCGWDSDSSSYLNWSQERTITYKLSGPAWGVESGYCILGLSPLARHAQLAATEKERDAFKAKLTEVEKEFDESRASQRAFIIELQDAMVAVFRYLSPPTKQFTPWRQQVIKQIDAIRAEREAARTQVQAMMGVMREARPFVVVTDHECRDERELRRCYPDSSAAIDRLRDRIDVLLVGEGNKG